MALIADKDGDFIRDHFAKQLTGDVRITFFTQHQSKLVVPPN